MDAYSSIPLNLTFDLICLYMTRKKIAFGEKNGYDTSRGSFVLRRLFGEKKCEGESFVLTLIFPSARELDSEEVGVFAHTNVDKTDGWANRALLDSTGEEHM